MRNWIFLGLLCSVAAVGCGTNDFQVASVTGRIVCEGAPVPHAMVFFEPLGSGGSVVVGKQGTAVADENGRFSISTYGDEDGAVIGKHRVRVSGPNRELYPGVSCPCEMNAEVDVMQVDVTDRGIDDLEIVLKKKAGKGKPSLDELEAMEDARQEAREKQRANKVK